MTPVVTGTTRVYLEGEQVGEGREVVIERLRDPEHVVERISTEWAASIKLVGGNARRALRAMRKLLPVLRELEDERRRREAAMRQWARRKGRKK